jgi:HTH-type transcriptional repressor of NAD biosynthesis genes
LKETFEGTNVEVCWDNRDIPQEPSESSDFWDIWVKLVKDCAHDVDVLFTSEDYGEEFAKKIGVPHVCVDKRRVTFPISGTLMRESIYKNWRMIPDVVKNYYGKRILVVGPESCGKSTLTRFLSKELNCGLVEEYGREYCQNRDTKSLRGQDFINIAQGHYEREIRERIQYPISISDTDAFTTSIFYHLYAPLNGDKFDIKVDAKIQSYELPYTLCLLLNTDVCWIQDGQRAFGHVRSNVMERFNNLYIPNVIGCPVVKITGTDYEERTEMALEAVKDHVTL